MINYFDLLSKNKIFPNNLLLLGKSNLKYEKYVNEIVKTISCLQTQNYFCNVCDNCKNVNNNSYNHYFFDLKKSLLAKQEIEQIKNTLHLNNSKESQPYFLILFSANLLTNSNLSNLLNEFKNSKKNCYLIFCADFISSALDTIKNFFLQVDLLKESQEQTENLKNSMSFNEINILEKTFSVNLKEIINLTENRIIKKNGTKNYIELFKSLEYREILEYLNYLNDRHIKDSIELLNLKDLINLNPIKSIMGMKILEILGDKY